ncbi:MAG: hypothetical protein CMJ78_02965 [Planctomycetaceae bacterium]|nr:hypothetical protein [Planctomycetaceae bacterium]
MKILCSILGLLCVGALPSFAHADDLLPASTPINEAIDHYIRKAWADEKIQPAARITDANLIRRLTLDLAGRVPGMHETKQYVASKSPRKWTDLVDRLLASPDFVYHHSNQLDEMLLPGDYNGGGDWQEYLRAAAKENRSWDKLFREMMLGVENDDAQKTALSFVRLRGKSLDDLTNDTSVVFFGVNIGCAKCHDHPLVGDWLQDHYFGMASFFNRTYMTKKNTVAEKYDGLVKFKTTSGEEKQAAFMFLTGTTIKEPAVEKTAEQKKAEAAEVQKQMKDAKAPPAKTPGFSPRTKLVELALKAGEDQFFARNIANRIWSRFMGHGLVHPLDQLHSENPASHPELLDWLRRDLAAHNYDLKRLIRGIVLSEAYARSSEWTQKIEKPAPEHFAVATTRALTPKQYGLSMVVSTSNPDDFDKKLQAENWADERKNLENAANSLASLIEYPGEYFQIGVDEALLISNSDRIQNNYLRDSRDRLLGYIKTLKTPKEKIDAAFWAVYSRGPESEEAAAFEQYLSKRDENDDNWKQILWALIAGPELRFNY